MLPDTTIEFQVSEYYDPSTKKIWLVQLEQRRVVKDQYGTPHYTTPWVKVNRVRFERPEGVL
jgi:hypothetical protein